MALTPIINNGSKPATKVATAPAAGGWARPGVMSNQLWNQSAANWDAPGGMKQFMMDWATKGGRGVIGAQGEDVSYENAIADLRDRLGIDVSGLPGNAKPAVTPEQMGALPADIANMLNMKRSDARAQYASMMAQLDQEQGRVTQNRDSSVNDFNRQTYDMRQALPGSFVGRGVYNSGIMQNAVAQFGQTRAAGLTDLQSQYQALVDNIASRRSGADQSLQSILSQIDQDELQRKSDQISSLKKAGLI
jgi:hypothetical protein